MSFFASEADEIITKRPLLALEIARRLRSSGSSPRDFTLTAKQRELLTFIEDFIEKNGLAPSFEEMKDGVGIGSKSGIYRLIVAFEERGHIYRKPGLARCMALRKPAQ